MGFSLIELVVTLVVLGILAAVAIPRLSSTGFDERGLRDNVVSALRYAQKSAMAARRTVCATFSNAPASVTFRISSAYGAANCSAGNVLAGPDGSALQVTAAGAAAFASVPASLVFDAAGRPSSAASISVAGLPATLAITVEAETGYVH